MLADLIINLFVFAIGASIGSFLNVVVYRIPAGISLVWPPSRCPKCLHPLGKTENVPVFGWLWLGGRCRWCHTSISFRYPLIEAATGLLFLLIFWYFGIRLETWGYWVFLSWLLALSIIDLDTMTLPNPLTQSGLLVGLGFQIVLGWQDSQWVGIANYLMSGIGGAVLGIWLFDVITIVGTLVLGQTAMGGGDAKLAATIGAWLGWEYLLLSSFLACAIGTLVVGSAIMLGLLSRRQPVPFGPFLALAAVITVFGGQDLISAYFRLFF